MTTAVSSLCRKNPHAPCDEQMPYWVEFQLVDEQGDAVAYMPWTVEIAHPVSGPVDNFTHSGQSDANGLIRIDMPHGLELRLTLDGEQLATEMEKRTLRVSRDAENVLLFVPKLKRKGISGIMQLSVSFAVPFPPLNYEKEKCGRHSIFLRIKF
ncbi:hypothetical protein [Enterobacter cloacae complex sp. SHL020]|uniref:hypothetical protein n=1 Tax=Enterobacter cloacae complex sp. SHL020 TaxID=3412401 RepID=UPI003B9F333E